MYLKNDKTGFPSLITLFSAPAYLTHFPNKAAILRYENNVMNIRQFNESPHPYVLPNYMNVFAWSLPFVAEKLGEFLLVFMNLVDDETEEVEEMRAEDLAARRYNLKTKVESVTKMLNMLRRLREERENVPADGDEATVTEVVPGEGTPEERPKPVDTLPHTPFKSQLDLSRSPYKKGTGDSPNESPRHPAEIDRESEARPAVGLEHVVESSSSCDSPRRLQRKASRDNIRESQKFRDTLQNIKLLRQLPPPALPTKINVSPDVGTGAGDLISSTAISNNLPVKRLHDALGERKAHSSGVIRFKNPKTSKTSQTATMTTATATTTTATTTTPATTAAAKSHQEKEEGESKT